MTVEILPGRVNSFEKSLDYVLGGAAEEVYTVLACGDKSGMADILREISRQASEAADRIEKIYGTSASSM